MLKSFVLSVLFVFVSSKGESYHGSSYLHTLEDPAWPPVHVAYNFKAEFQFQFWEPTIKKLIPYANMNGTQIIDSAGNRERVDVWLQMDKLGMQPIK